MKRFDVIVSEDAKHDFKAAHDYIEFSLHNPSAADSLLEKIIEERDCRIIAMVPFFMSTRSNTSK